MLFSKSVNKGIRYFPLVGCLPLGTLKTKHLLTMVALLKTPSTHLTRTVTCFHQLTSPHCQCIFLHLLISHTTHWSIHVIPQLELCIHVITQLQLYLHVIPQLELCIHVIPRLQLYLYMIL